MSEGMNMKNGRVIFETENKEWRIVEHFDHDADINNLKGDCFDFERSGYQGTREELAQEERDFEELVDREGVYGYVLERWNPTPGKGYEHVDSCWGFVGQYSESDKSGLFNHYIVEEMKSQIVDGAA
jgi:hypothetical protein